MKRSYIVTLSCFIHRMKLISFCFGSIWTNTKSQCELHKWISHGPWLWRLQKILAFVKLKFVKVLNKPRLFTLGRTCCEHFASQVIDCPTLFSSSFALNRSFVLTIIIIITSTIRCCMHMVSDISKNEKPYKQESKKNWKTLNKKPKKEEERNPIVTKKRVPKSENKKKWVTWKGEEKREKSSFKWKWKSKWKESQLNSSI